MQDSSPIACQGSNPKKGRLWNARYEPVSIFSTYFCMVLSVIHRDKVTHTDTSEQRLKGRSQFFFQLLRIATCLS